MGLDSEVDEKKGNNDNNENKNTSVAEDNEYKENVNSILSPSNTEVTLTQFGTEEKQNELKIKIEYETKKKSKEKKENEKENNSNASKRKLSGIVKIVIRCIIFLILIIVLGLIIFLYHDNIPEPEFYTFKERDPNFHIYLGFGQSNMEGHGLIEEQDQIKESRFKMISTTNSRCMGRRLGKWYDALSPLAHCHSYLGPMDNFGRTLIKKLPEEIKVGVIVVAVGGCKIELFDKDNYRDYKAQNYQKPIIKDYSGNPYGRLIKMAKKAQKAGVIKGILLHQGESNQGEATWPSNVKAVYENILKDLNLKSEDVPLLAGEVVHESVNGQCAIHNELVDHLPDIIPTCHVISSKDLPAHYDNLHFTSESYRKLGERYANEMLKILGYE